MSLDQHGRTDSRRDDVAAVAGVPVAEAVAEALASVRLEGLEPDGEGLRVLDEVAAGRMSITDAVEHIVSAARVVA